MTVDDGSTVSPSHVVVIGGGVSGLAAAHRVTELAPHVRVTVLEAGERPGGILQTEITDDGFVIERGPDSIITDKPWAVALAKRIGLGDEIVGTRSDNRGAYVVAHGRLERIPEGFSLLAPVKAGPFLRSPILSWSGKVRAGLDLLLPRGRTHDESLGSFVSRRFGPELLDRLAQPMASGIYGADPWRLSLRATMPRFLDLEQQSRSVALGLRRRAKKAAGESASGARYGLFVNFRKGAQTLPNALVDRLGDRVRVGAPVRSLRRDGDGWTIVTGGGETGEAETLEADRVVLAVPAPVSSRLLEGVDPELSQALSSIPYGSAATTVFAWRTEQIPHPMDAYGFVVPVVENRSILASTWMSRKWPGRAPEGKELIRVFLGGAGREDIVEHGTDEELVRTSLRELRDLMGIRADPELVRIDRYVGAMPQYQLGHLDRVARIESLAAQQPGLLLAGNALRGVGVPDSVRSGETAGEAALGGP